MRESVYIVATNRVKVSMALHILRDTLAGDEYGIDASKMSHIRRELKNIEERLFSLIEIDD